MDAATVESFHQQFTESSALPLRLATHALREDLDEPRRVVLVCRDPLDVLASFYHYATNREHQSFSSRQDFLQSKHYGVPRLAKWWNSWSPSAATARVITYEDMRDNPVPALRRTLRGLAIHVSDDVNLRAITRKWDFDRRQAHEKQQTDSADTNALFVRRGQVGGGREELTEAEIGFIGDALDKNLTPTARELMSSFGYLEL